MFVADVVAGANDWLAAAECTPASTMRCRAARSLLACIDGVVACAARLVRERGRGAEGEHHRRLTTLQERVFAVRRRRGEVWIPQTVTRTDVILSLS